MALEFLEIERFEEEVVIEEKATEYTYALLYYMSEVKLISWKEQREKIDFSQLLEARFFQKEKELHYFQEEEKAVAVEVREKENAEFIEENIILGKNFTDAGNYLKVRKYIDYDEDGQAHVALTRLVDVKGGE